MTNDIQLTVAIGANANSVKWKNQKMRWSDLAEKLKTAVRTNETLSQFLRYSKADQGRIKDVGGFVGGTVLNGKRRVNNVLNRQLVTLDIDYGHKHFIEDFQLMYDYAAVIHATHKSSPENPRYRIIIPLDREVTPEEYGAISRRIAEDIGQELFDKSTFQVNRLMFWPSVPCDVEYEYYRQEGPVLCADDVLDTYFDWKDVGEWPMMDDENKAISLSVKKQEDPTSKSGVIGAFCRTYDVHEAISAFLSDVYEEAGDNRYTYMKGSTSAGVIVYDDLFSYSHHGTDPAGNRLCNAFDLVRIHKFGYLDEGSRTENSSAKSMKAMEEFAAKDPKVKHVIADEKLESAKYDFGSLEEEFEEEEDEGSDAWVEELEIDTKGNYTSTAQNLNIIVKNDKVIKNCFKYNTFDGKYYISRSLPWRKLRNGEPEPLRDVDFSGIRNYIESVYGIVSVGKIDDAIKLEFERNSYHPIQEYLNSLEWDGRSRVDYLLTDYFGVEDNAYSRAAIRKTLCGAVARVFCPGVKFDLALILVGPQGSYKSTFINHLGKKWFSDTFSTVQGKEAFEQVRGAWLIEMAELTGLKKAEVESVKQFISKREDQYRPAFGRVIEVFPRQCVFIGTTNSHDFLKDPTGNRRFMPVDCCPENAIKSVAEDLEEEVDQIWAEAVALYKAGEPLYLQDEAKQIASTEQKKHSESDERTGIIEEYLDKSYPENWVSYTMYERLDWLSDPLAKKGTEPKKYTCIAEIWCECLGRKKEDLSRYNSREINDIMRGLEDWEYVSSTRYFPLYGKQKYYQKK